MTDEPLSWDDARASALGAREFVERRGRFEARKWSSECSASVVAAELMGELADELARMQFRGHALEVFLVRLSFSFFAEHTGIWERGLLFEFFGRTAADGSDLGPSLQLLFRVLDTPQQERSTMLDESLARFPHLEDGLFRERVDTPEFNRGSRAKLFAIAELDWSAVSPAVFGSMFQSVLDSMSRRSLGAHYTSEQNILQVIQPLFLDALREEFEAARDDAAGLRALHEKIATLRLFDPAAGCGNFLVVAYRELRRLEFDLLVRLEKIDEKTRQGFDRDAIDELTKVNVGQCYAIEIEEFPALIAETALLLVEHLENVRLAAEFGVARARFPSKSAAHVTRGNACRIDWDSVLPARECSYLLGNPPFLGRQYRSEQQKQDMARAHEDAPGHGVLDFVTAWYAIAARYLREQPHVRAAFVSTNSICQGEAVPALWPRLFAQGIDIDFALRSFPWSNEARHRAGVHVVVIGFSWGPEPKKKLLFEPVSSTDGGREELLRREVPQINAYLAVAANVIVEKARRPLVSWVPEAEYGSMANDGGGLIVTPDQVEELRADPIAAKYLREYVGAEEVFNSTRRWCLWLVDATPDELATSRSLRDRLAAVAAHRAASGRGSTKAAASTPSLFVECRPQKEDYIFVPFVSSEKRSYVPHVIKSAADICAAPHWRIPSADPLLFGIVSSRMYATWVETVCGRLEMRLRLSPGTVYNTFPFPDAISDEARACVEDAARNLLEVRASFSESLQVLYVPERMPSALSRAHQELDRAVDALFSSETLAGDQERLAVLFERYGVLTSGRRDRR